MSHSTCPIKNKQTNTQTKEEKKEKKHKESQTEDKITLCWEALMHLTERPFLHRSLFFGQFQSLGHG